MGYIMPIENYQYQQYHQRVTNKKRDPFPIEKLYPIPFQQQYEHNHSGEEFVLNNAKTIDDKGSNRTDKQKLPFFKEQNQRIYAKITGKGKRFIAEA